MPISTYSTTAGNNTALFPENMAPSAVNDGMRQVQADIRSWFEDAQWVNLGDTPSRASASTFKITGDVTAKYEANRKIKLYDSSTIYALITASSYSAPDTTVTVDSSSLTASLSSVALAILTATNNAIPGNFSTSTLTVTGATTLSGAAVCKTTLTAEGALTAASTVTVSGAAVAKTTLTVEGATTLSGAVVCKSTLDVEGAIINVKGTSSQSGYIRLYEDSDNGSNYGEHRGATSYTANRTYTWPDRDLTIGNSTAWEFISSQTASTSSSIDFTDLSSDYSIYKLIYRNVKLTGEGQLLLRVSSDNGSSFDSGAGNYDWARHDITETGSGASSISNDGNGSVTSIELARDVGNETSDSLSGEVTIYNAGRAIKTFVHNEYVQQTKDDQFRIGITGGSRQAANTTNAIRLQPNTTTIANGVFYLYGIREAA